MSLSKQNVNLIDRGHNSRPRAPVRAALIGAKESKQINPELNMILDMKHDNYESFTSFT